MQEKRRKKVVLYKNIIVSYKNGSHPFLQHPKNIFVQNILFIKKGFTSFVKSAIIENAKKETDVANTNAVSFFIILVSHF